jgi:TPR repeat protein
MATAWVPGEDVMNTEQIAVHINGCERTKELRNGWIRILPMALLLGALAPNSIRAADATHADEVRATKAAAEHGDASSQNQLGDWLNSGEKGLAKDHAAAMKWYTRAADQNSFEATISLGVAYNDGKEPPGLKTPSAEAAQWYQRIAEHGAPMAQYFLGNMYALGNGVARDDAHAVRLWRQAAAKNNAMAQISLGYFYEIGAAERLDDIPARPWYLRGDQIDAASESLWDLAWGFLSGIGGPRDDRMAIMWLRLAAEQGNLDAQKELAYSYENGLGIEKNPELANAWYRKAALKGDALIQVQLGFQYHEGKGVAQDDVEALRWFRLAAEQGNMMSQLMAASLLGDVDDDKGQSRVEAIKWANRAAEQGMRPAQHMLAGLYEIGFVGLAKDPTMAYVWEARADSTKTSPGKDSERLRQKLDAQQLAKAEQQIAGWKPKEENDNSSLAGVFRSTARPRAAAKADPH